MKGFRLENFWPLLAQRAPRPSVALREPERSEGTRLAVEAVTADLRSALPTAAGLPSVVGAAEPRARGVSQVPSK